MAKILAVSHDSSLYGAQRSLLDIVSGLTSKGHQVDVCVPNQGLFVDSLRTLGITVYIVNFDRWIPSSSDIKIESKLLWLKYLLHLPKSLAKITKIIRSGQYEVVYTNTVTVLDFAIAAWLCHIPHVWHLRESAADNPQLKSPLSNRRVIALVSCLSDQVIFNSNYLQRKYAAPANKKFSVIYNGIQIQTLPPLRPPRLPNIPLSIVTIGYMERRKGLDVLLDALILLPLEQQLKIQLTVAGLVEEKYLATEIAPRLARVASRVVLMGWVDSIDALLKSSDLLVSSARDEPFGRTLIEAMMVGVPILSTRSGGPEEIIIDGVTGLLVHSEAPNEIADALTRLIDKPSILNRLGAAGYERASSTFSLQSYVEGVENTLLSHNSKN